LPLQGRGGGQIDKFEIFQILNENQVFAFNLSGLMSQFLILNKLKKFIKTKKSRNR
jgi:hypothetical protein